jgi:hypothetical protein
LVSPDEPARIQPQLNCEEALMGLMFRRRRPVARLAAGAATAGIAYHAGRRRAEQDAYNDQAAAAYEATQGAVPQYAPPPYPTAPYPAPAYAAAPAPAPAPAASPGVEELGRLVALHDAGDLTDAEFSAAKAKLLGF